MKIILPRKRPWKKVENYAKKILLYEKDIKGKIEEIMVAKFKPDTKKDPHYHKKMTEIFYILKGGGKIIVNKEELECHPGEVIICEPNDIHQVINDTDKSFEFLVMKIKWEKGDIYFV